MTTDADVARRAVFDPATTRDDLARLAEEHPGLRGVIAEHPNADASLRAWVASLGAPTPEQVAAALPVPVEPVPPPVEPVETEGSLAQSPAAEPPRRHRWVGPLVGLVVLALVAAAGLTYRFVVWPARDIPEWTQVFGGTGDEWFHAVAVAPDGGIVVVGSVQGAEDGPFARTSAGVGPLALVAGFRADGTLAWSKVFAGEGGDSLNGVAVDPRGDIVAVGAACSASGDFPARTSQGCDQVVVKLSPVGDIVWATRLGIGGLAGVAVDAAGAITAVGYAEVDDGGPQLDAAIVRLAADGTVTWSKTFGGSGNEMFLGVAVDDAGGAVVAGFTESSDGDYPLKYPVDPTSGTAADGVVLRLAPDGTVVWSQMIGGGFWDYLDAVVLTADGGIVVAGVTASTDGDFAGSTMTRPADAAALVRLSLDGTVTWARTYGGVSEGAFTALFSLAEARNGDLVAAGATSVNVTGGDFPPAHDGSAGGDALVARFTPTGDIRWAQTLGGGDAERFEGVTLARDGDVIAIGNTASLDGLLPPTHGGTDALILRVSPDGVLGPA